MTCLCGNNRILSLCAKSSDSNSIAYMGHHVNGYVPPGLNIGDGDYVNIEICMQCGRVQGKFPVHDDKVREALTGE